MKTRDTKIIKETFQKISDIVTPTMGAKGRMAIIADEMGRPFLTDDGVTVAKECLKFDEPFERMVATSLCEAAHNTEKSAFDGTTLTVLLTNEFYKAGLKLIKAGIHPQVAADTIAKETNKLLIDLDSQRMSITKSNKKLVQDVAIITTKMPMIGELVYQAYLKAGDNMNVLIEHDRKGLTHSVEHIEGMVLDAGYFSESLRSLCGNDGKFYAENAKLILLAEGILTVNGMKALLGSIENNTTPLIFFVDKNFNPDSMKELMDALVSNRLPFMFVFINDNNPEELFADIAARTGGTIQSGALGTIDYTLDLAGTAKKIVIEQDKTTILAYRNEEAIKARLEYYNNELKEKKFNLGFVRADIINRRIANLDKGIVKIKLACPTVTEFATIRLKLDDAIGAVRCACKDGVALGAGKTLYLLSEKFSYIKEALQSPALTILKNAGIRADKKVLASSTEGYNVVTGEIVDLKEAGIIDSLASIKAAITNGSSIAVEYLRGYILINGLAN